MPPNSFKSWVRISSTPSIPSRRQTKAAETTTSTPMVMIDQPTGRCARRGRGSGSASSDGA